MLPSAVRVRAGIKQPLLDEMRPPLWMEGFGGVRAGALSVQMALDWFASCTDKVASAAVSSLLAESSRFGYMRRRQCLQYLTSLSLPVLPGRGYQHGLNCSLVV